MIDAVIFDCDGTLVDSEVLSLQVLVDYIAELGLDVPHEEAMSRFAGTNLSLVFSELAGRLNRPLPEDHVEEFRRRQIERLRRDLQPMEGAAPLLEAMTLPFCVASNAPRPKIRVCLEETGLAKHFDETRIFSAYDIDRWKPEPDLFFAAADRLGVRPERCAVVEDSTPGIEAGLAAGMTVFALDPHGKMSSNTASEGVQSRPLIVRSLAAVAMHLNLPAFSS